MRAMLSVGAVLLVGACGDTAAPGDGGPLSPAPQSAVVAFTGVRVVPMDAERVLDDQTVVVRHGVIASIGPRSATQVPRDAFVVEGRGRYLIPGLVDSHVHARLQDLPAYLRHGVTSVRNMWGYPALLDTSHDPDDPANPYPSIYSASPGVDDDPPKWPHTYLVHSPADAREAVEVLAAQGWEFIKAYVSLAPEAYDELLNAAADAGVRVVGHVPFSVPVQHALERGHASIEHLTGYDRALGGGAIGPASWSVADLSQASALAALTAVSGTWNCPTMVVLDALARANLTGAALERSREARREMVRALHASGARLLAGTDAGIDVVPAGVSLHDELAEFVASGLSPYDALRAATRDAAAFLLRSGEFGVIAPNSRADLVLLDGNPLTDIQNTRRIAGVMLRGRWYVR